MGSFLFSFSLFWFLGALLNPGTRDAAQIANVAFGREGFLLWLANNLIGRGDFAFCFCHFCHESVKRAGRGRKRGGMTLLFLPSASDLGAMAPRRFENF